MRRFALPASVRWHPDELRKQLRGWTWVFTVCQLLIIVAFPLAEAILVGYMTSDASLKGLCVKLLWVCGPIHLLLVAVILGMGTPLPKYLTEFDAQETELEETKETAKAQADFAGTFSKACLAANASLSVIRERSVSTGFRLQETLDLLLKPWVELKEEIFWYRERGDLYNLAVYLCVGDQLVVQWREHDDRIVTRNRPWAIGVGHVGICFANRHTIVSPDSGVAGVRDLLSVDGDEDLKNYRSLLSSPIQVGEDFAGVFVVTSSRADQFDPEIHAPIAEIIAGLIGQSIQCCHAGKYGELQCQQQTTV